MPQISLLDILERCEMPWNFQRTCKIFAHKLIVDMLWNRNIERKIQENLPENRTSASSLWEILKEMTETKSVQATSVYRTLEKQDNSTNKKKLVKGQRRGLEWYWRDQLYLKLEHME